MKRGYLSEYFDGAACKILSAVEADNLSSHQHEFNGVSELKRLLGEPTGRKRYEARFLYLTDYEDDPIIENGTLTWYDARQRARETRKVMRWEYRLYFSDTQASLMANPGDVLIIAKQKNGELLAIFAEKDTTIASQIMWLFGFSASDIPRFSIREELETEQDRIEFTSRIVLESIGIEIENTNESYLDDMLSKFDSNFPPTKKFSQYARSTLEDFQPNENNCDEILMAWLEKEEILFKTLERYLVAERLSKGFNEDIEGFISYSLSVQNRRKSRAGLSLENHLEALFQKLSVQYTRTPTTENRAKPDFLFPSIDHYRDQGFPSEDLTMLGVKTTCKDRWRQVLSEAARIEFKHLLTLEPAISLHQTNEMISNKLQLVVPESLQHSYKEEQQKWILSLKDFVLLLREKQKILI